MSKARPDRTALPTPEATSLVSISILAAAGALLVVVLMLFVDAPMATALRSVPDRDVALATLLSKIGSGYLALTASFLATVVFWLGRHVAFKTAVRALWRRRFRAAAFVSLSSLAATAIGTFLKAVIGRPRPVLFTTDGPFAFHPLSTAEVWTSFPSGETTMVTAVFAALMLVLAPRLGLRRASLLLLFPALVAMGRVASEAHYVSDVVAAFLLSLGVVSGLYRVAARRDWI